MSPAASSAAAPRRLALGTAAFVLGSVLVQVVPTLRDALVFERAALERAELWRALTGHMVHGTAQVARIDIAAFLVFGAWVELTSRRLFLVTLAASAIGSSAVVYFLTDYERYVGSSALSSGLAISACLVSLSPSRGAASRVAALFVLVLFAIKLILELDGSRPALLGELPPGHEPAAAAHLAGALGGVAAVYGERRARSARSA